MHLGCCGKLILHCSTVPDDVREREAVSVVMKAKMKRKRKDAAAALEEASVERQVVHEVWLKKNLSRGIVTFRGGKMITPPLRNGAFGSGVALNWTLLDEALVDFWCINTPALGLLGTV